MYSSIHAHISISPWSTIQPCFRHVSQSSKLTVLAALKKKKKKKGVLVTSISMFICKPFCSFNKDNLETLACHWDTSLKWNPVFKFRFMLAVQFLKSFALQPCFLFKISFWQCFKRAETFYITACCSSRTSIYVYLCLFKITHPYLR